MTTRRTFLMGAGATLVGAARAGGLAGGVGAALGGFAANAASVSGYRALVCVFLLGGMDNHDTIIPYDQTSYDRWAQIRTSFLPGYSGGRDRSALLQLSPDNASAFDGRSFALPPQMAGIHGLFQSGQAAIVGNVGPLIEPVTRADVLSERAILPKRLFSHNDQQSTWMSSQPEGAQFGWGGLFADAVQAASANFNPAFTAITTLGNEVFLTGDTISPYQAPVGNTIEVEVLRFFEDQRATPEGEATYQLLRQHLRGGAGGGDNLIARDVAAALTDSLDTNALYNEARESAPPLSTAFPPNFLGQQLATVAQTIALRTQLQARRQIFFVGLGGFDTHSTQAQDLPARHGEIDSAITAFYQAMVALGLEQDVTLFTASDFGRTLAVNGDGTDHGWGGHQLVVGGAVQGRQILGGMPPAEFDHEYDVGGGRLIPQVSVEEFAAPLGRWFGLNEGEVNAALPNLGNFSAPPLAFV